MPITLGAQCSPFQRVAGARRFVTVDHPPFNFDPGFTGADEPAMLLENPMRVAHIVFSRRQTLIVRLDHCGVESASAEVKTAFARRLGLQQCAAPVTDAACGIGHKRRAAHAKSERSRRELSFAFRVNELIEVDEHLDTQVARIIVAAR